MGNVDELISDPLGRKYSQIDTKVILKPATPL
jgi:hypothetical protein